MNDPELKAMGQIAEAMNSLDDDGTRARVLEWAISKYLGGATQRPQSIETSNARRIFALTPPTPAASFASIPKSLEDIVEVNDEGQIRVITRDLKAKSRNDAAIRLTHIVIYANEKLSNEKEVSSKNVLLPVLKEWRAYDPNTRVAIARHQGIKRNGDLLSLDLHSRREAEKYIAEIHDESVKGTWNVVQSRKKKKRENGAEHESE